MAVAVAVAVSGGGAVPVAVPVAGLTKRFFNHIQKDFLINVWSLFEEDNQQQTLFGFKNIAISALGPVPSSTCSFTFEFHIANTKLAVL